MKKLLSIILVLSMLLTSCILLASCGKVSVKDVEKDAYATISAAMQNSYDSFFTDDANVGKAIENALKCGAFTLSFESDELMGGDITKISETFYVDSKNEKLVSDTSVTYGGKSLGALLYLDEAGMKLKSESILGSDKALALNIDSVKEDLKGSTFAELFELDDEMVDQLIEMINTLETELETNSKENLKKAKEFYNELCALCNQTVTEEKIEKDKYVVVTYTINNETLKSVLNKYMEFMGEYYSEEMTDEFKTAFDEMIAELDGIADVFLFAKLYINKKTNEIAKMTFDGTVTPTEYPDEKADISAELAFSESEIKMTFGVDIPNEESISAQMLIAKEKKGGNVAYDLSLKAKTGSVEIDLLNASYTYEKNGNISLKADVYNDVYDRTKIELKGSLTATKNEMKIEFTSFTLNEETTNFKATFSAKALSEIPAAPSDAKDVVTLTEDEWIEIMGEIENSELGKLIFGTAPEYYY